MLTNSKVELVMMASHDSIRCSPACVPCFACIADKTNGGVATTDWRTSRLSHQHGADAHRDRPHKPPG